MAASSPKAVVDVFGENIEFVKKLDENIEIIGLYFSAHWCPPCRQFTPVLGGFYDKMKTHAKYGNGKFEVIFVSSDKDEQQWSEYFKTMPFNALPFSQRDLKAKASKKFKVTGIPTLVLLDAKTGKTICRDARKALTQDQEGKDFPWAERSIPEIMDGIKLLGKPPGGSGDEKLPVVDGNEVLAGKKVGFYFSAHWCPPCKGFTPKLVATYKKLQDDGKAFEIIFISSDRSESSFKEYFAEMPWLALPYDDSRRKDELATLFSVESIPTLIIVDENRKVICASARHAVAEDPEGKDFPWCRKPLQKLTGNTAAALNDSVCLVLFTDGEEKQVQAAEEALMPQALEYYKESDEQDLYFFYATEDGICDNLRNFVGLDEEPQLPQLAIFDISSQRYYLCKESCEKFSAEQIKHFVADWKSGKLEKASIEA